MYLAFTLGLALLPTFLTSFSINSHCLSYPSLNYFSIFVWHWAFIFKPLLFSSLFNISAISSDNRNDGAMDIAYHRHSSSCEQNSQFFLYRSSHNHLSSLISTANSTNITVAYTNVDTILESESQNVFHVVSPSHLQV